MSGKIRRTTPAQALAGIVTAELIAATEAATVTRYQVQVQEVTLAELAAKPCARPGCGHRLDQHGYHGGLSAFRWSACSNLVIVEETLAACGCPDFVHG